MPFDTPEEALLFDIEQALRSFKFAPPLKKDRAEMAWWKEQAARHILAHLLQCNWELRRKESRETGAGALMMPPPGEGNP